MAVSLVSLYVGVTTTLERTRHQSDAPAALVAHIRGFEAQ
jgi:hypothetical protein